MKCKFEGVDIKAITTYLPPKIREMDSMIPIYGKKVVEQTVKGSGIERLHVADDDQTSSDMCYEAAEHLIIKEQIDRSTIDGLVMVSQTFDYNGPASSIILQDRLKLAKDTVCFDIIYGCSGYIYGVYQAAMMIASGSCINVLLVNGETNTKLMDDREKDQVMVFGDCASATFITKGEGKLAFHILSDGSRHKAVVNLVNGFRTPILLKNNEVPIKDDGKPVVALNDGMAVFDFIINDGSGTIRTMLEYMNWDKDEVDFYALHQAVRVTLNFLRKRLKLDKKKSPFYLQNYGNTSSTTIPLVLSSYVHDKQIDTSNWKKVIMCGFGIGLSWGSIACDLSKTKIYKPINQ
jgi:3-oxoacyl-[acyl-carrier-protein] synthase III